MGQVHHPDAARRESLARSLFRAAACDGRSSDRTSERLAPSCGTSRIRFRCLHRRASWGLVAVAMRTSDVDRGRRERRSAYIAAPRSGSTRCTRRKRDPHPSRWNSTPLERSSSKKGPRQIAQDRAIMTALPALDGCPNGGIGVGGELLAALRGPLVLHLSEGDRGRRADLGDVVT